MGLTGEVDGGSLGALVVVDAAGVLAEVLLADVPDPEDRQRVLPLLPSQHRHSLLRTEHLKQRPYIDRLYCLEFMTMIRCNLV